DNREPIMQLVILAAGQGTRLGDKAQNKPKCLVAVNANDVYFSRQLTAFNKFSFSKKMIVGGYGIDVLKAFLQQQGEADYELITNTEFHKGNLYSLLAAKNGITDGFYIFNADHYYSPETYEKMLTTAPSQITIYCDQDRDLSDDDMKVLSCENSILSIDKKLHDFDYGYVGVTFVPQHKLQTYWQAVEATTQRLGDKAHVEAVLNELITHDEKINIVDISGSWWTEIDTPEDLVQASKIIFEATKDEKNN
ncbi:NTP transferase domain-containing protein, partial [bacterium]|nr:NTP transferase domain-containing protein [bacterium]